MNFLFLAIFLSGILLTGCSKNDNGSGTGMLSVRLTDAPAMYQEVLIDVQEVMINIYDSEEDGWITLNNVSTGVYNLLDFTNGMDTLIAEEMVPEGKISQMRLVLGSNNKVKINDVYYNLATPSSQQSGLKFNIHGVISSGYTYKIWIDFDAEKSIVEKGNGSYSLNPVIRTFTKATSGAIDGSINPVASKPIVRAISSELDTFSTYADTLTGYFKIQALNEGTYKLVIEPLTDYTGKEIEDVIVTNGSTTNLGTINIEIIIPE